VGLEDAPKWTQRSPKRFVNRADEIDGSTKLLVDSVGGGHRIAALWGPPGCGKTTLAAQLFVDERVRRSFPHSPIWLTLGDLEDSLSTLFQELIDQINDGGSSSFHAASTLRTLLRRRKSLIVVDDLWKAAHLWALSDGVLNCGWLVTTGDKDTLENVDDDRIVDIKEMRREEAVALLKARFQRKDQGLDLLEDDISELAERLDRWPLFLNEASRYLARLMSDGFSLSEAVTSLNEDLDANGLTALDENGAVSPLLGRPLKQLNSKASLHLQELAVFPKGVEIPIEVIGEYWSSSTPEMKPVDVRNLCQRFYRLALLHSFNPRSIRIHKGISEYLKWNQRSNLVDLHRQFLEVHPFGPEWSAIPESNTYLWEHLTCHLIGAGRDNELIRTAKDWRFLVKKLTVHMSHSAANRMLTSLENDLLQAETIAEADPIIGALSRGFLSIEQLFDKHQMDERDIKSTLFARFLLCSDALQEMLDDLERHIEPPYIRFHVDQESGIHAPGEDTTDYLNKGQHRFITCCAYYVARPWIVSASFFDHTLELWDADTGRVHRTFNGHSQSVNGCAFSHDGTRVVSASSDRTIRIWQVDSGECGKVLTGPASSANCCEFSPDDNHIVAGYSDGTLIIWDVTTGEQVHCLRRVSSSGVLVDEIGAPLLDQEGNPIQDETDVEVDGHSGPVNDCAYSSDGQLILSASDDGALKLWDTNTGAPETLGGRSKSGRVKACAFDPRSQLIVSASSDRSLTLWDVQTRTWLRELRRGGEIRETSPGESTLKVNGHLGEVNDCGFSSDGQLITSASDDCTLKVWEVESGRCIATFYDHEGINCCSMGNETIVAGGIRGIYFLQLVKTAAPNLTEGDAT